MTPPAGSVRDVEARREQIKASRLEIEANKAQFETQQAKLDNIVAGLSTWEIRRLRDQLNEISMEKDICKGLPIEVFLLLVEHLDLEDVLNARCVSRAWHSLFTSEEFCLDIIKLRFRSKWENDYAPLNTKGRDAAKPALSMWLTGQAKDRIRKLHGHYDSMEVYWYNKNVEEQDLPDRATRDGPTDHQYCNGRIAFKMQSRSVIVRNLRGVGSLVEEQSKTFRDRNREPIDKFLLSDEWLIWQKSSPLMLMAWPLRDIYGPDHTFGVRLPGHFRSWFAYHDRVGIINSETEIMIWDIGGELRPVDISEIRNNFAGFDPVAIVFHPDQRQRFFLASHGTVENDPEIVTLRVAMHEFVKGDLDDNYHLADGYHSDERLDDPIGMLSHFRMVDSSTGFFYGAPLSKNNSATSSHASFCLHTGQNGMEILGLTFDIYTREFSERVYHLPDLTGNKTRTIRCPREVDHEQVFFRRDQVLVPVYLDTYRIYGYPVPVDDILLMAINDCIQASNSASAKMVPWYGQNGHEDTIWYGRGGFEDSKPYFVPPSAEHGRCNISYSWFQGPLARVTGRSSWSYNDVRGEIRGDDDFIVMFGDYGYYVWCLNECFTLPISHSRRDKWLLEERQLPNPLKKRSPYGPFLLSTLSPSTSICRNCQEFF